MRVGVVGLGWAGQQHIKAYQQLEGVELVGVAGLEADLRDSFGVPGFEDYRELLGLGLDAVSVAVPTFLHAPVAIAALQSGAHVLCEKPIARDHEQAEAMVAAAREAGRVLQVVFNHRRRGDIQRLKQLDLGHVYYAKAWWLRRSGVPTPGSWFTQSELSGGGPLVDIGVHVLDYALFLLGNPGVVSVSASTYDLLGTTGFGGGGRTKKTGVSDIFDVEDLATVFMRLDDGATLLLEASWAMHRADGDEFGVTLYGTKGGAELRVVDYAPRGELTHFGDRDGEPVAERLEVGVGDEHAGVVADFVQTIRSGDWEGHDGAAAAELARVVDASYRSAAEQREVSLSALPSP